MAGGGFAAHGRPAGDYEGGVTVFVIVACVIAAMGGLLFGYDLGISGGVTSMADFLEKFFPSVYERMKDRRAAHNNYCIFDNHLLTLFTSSLYLAAIVSAFFTANLTRALGRKVSVFIGGLAFLSGAVINGTAINIAMLIIGRLFLGLGVGFSTQAGPIYLSEMAPAKIRGALGIGIFQVAISAGNLIATFVNYETASIRGGWGWRVSLGLAAVPAVVMTVGSLFLPDTPNSILERGRHEEARTVLQKIRGTANVDNEFKDLVAAGEAAKKVENSWRTMFLPRYRPQLAMSFLFPVFQQFTGISVIMFYSPLIFMTLGFGDKAALMSATITGLVNAVATFVAVFSVDKFGRRALLLEGGAQMIICQIAIGGLIGLRFGVTGEGYFSKGEADLLLVLVCGHVAAFGWSWGPLTWLIPCEICPLEVRSSGQAVNVFGNNLVTFIIAQVFLTMLCHMKFGIFFLFGALMILTTTIFVFFFVPETKNVPIEEMGRVFKKHWFWCKYIPDEALAGGIDGTNHIA